ncbi:MAG: RNA 2',3'-cyclic phosphodiesterase [Candidatus Cloacimonetes bacterium]|nr:RNA 2',3'-cyclic phosphodiesterase [Candidatus Cloacimonadota bacterium]MDD4156007.1 RNA 2',3'-cyclic phosphodiesterase [Candidatus Cloacimonadota bacterium]
MIRTFLALTLDNQEQEKLTKIVHKAKTYFPNIKWVELNNFHLTFLFLGDTKPQDITIINDTLKIFANKLTTINLSDYNTKISVNNPNNPKTLWLDYTAKNISQKKFITLKSDRDTFINNLKLKIPYIDFKNNHQFKLHITLGRVKIDYQTPFTIPLDLTQFYQENPIQPILNKLSLIQSTLSPIGPTYKELNTVYLKNI